MTDPHPFSLLLTQSLQNKVLNTCEKSKALGRDKNSECFLEFYCELKVNKPENIEEAVSPFTVSWRMAQGQHFL